MAKKIINEVKGLATGALEETLEDAKIRSLEKLDPLLEELLALKEEVQSLRKIASSTKTEVSKFKKSLESRFEVLELNAERVERIFRLLRKIPLVRRLF